ncbi:hypothetical protein CSB20_06980 [bacterium DOLZORAL124_64_63]|nr:MAG: hypothetical protein CSB20_10675 [bacterium DOLZORAL124_64_63]PID80548.1 MAG: hypothetical protein CSB20_06980 [bacterium DOLZORAL124_64_63]
MSKKQRYSPEVRERAVRMVLDHERDYSSRWQTIVSIASKFGCTAESLRRWIQQYEVDNGSRDGRSSEDKALIKELQRENRELRQTNEILRKASAFFAQAELDRKPK